MIKESTYIREFTDKQRRWLETVGSEFKLKRVPDMLFLALEKFLEQRADIARLNRIIEYKQKKIDKLNEQIDAFNRRSQIQDQDGHIDQTRLQE